MLERAPRRLRWEVLPEVAQREDLDSILKDLVDNAIGVVEDFTDRGLMPLGNHTTLLRKLPEQLDSSYKPIKPLEGCLRTISGDVVYGRLCLSSGGG